MLIHNAILSVAEANATFELLLFWLLRRMSKYCFALIQSLFNSIFPCAQGNTSWDMWTNVSQGVFVLCLVLMVLGWFWRRRLSRKCLSGKCFFFQIIGAIFKSIVSILLTIVLMGVVFLLTPKFFMRLEHDDYSSPYSMSYKVGLIVVSCILFGVATYVITNLNKLFSLRKQEIRITVNQIALLVIFGVCFMLIVFALGIKQNGNGFIIVTTFGAVLGWIFQDTIKSVAAFFYLRANGLLRIGDLITVQSRGIEGFVRTISLTTVTVENWDTTTSSFPTYILHSEHFKNSQRMMEGKTYGRLMQKAFVLDTGWIRPLSAQDVERLRVELDLDPFVLQKIIKNGMLNIEAFRQYIYHWLMAYPRVSQQPRLVVRWLEQTDEGMPLQLFVYLRDTMFDAFEWQQSLIMEHVIKSMGWFDLQLYQSPSGYDASNSNVFLASHEADYHKKEKDNAHVRQM